MRLVQTWATVSRTAGFLDIKGAGEFATLDEELSDWRARLESVTAAKTAAEEELRTVREELMRMTSECDVAVVALKAAHKDLEATKESAGLLEKLGGISRQARPR